MIHKARGRSDAIRESILRLRATSLGQQYCPLSCHQTAAARRGGTATPPPLTRTMTPRGGAHLAAVDMYCGGGGSSAGLAMAGVDVALGIDHDAAARACFSRLHAAAACVGADCADLDAVVAAVRAALGPQLRCIGGSFF